MRGVTSIVLVVLLVTSIVAIPAVAVSSPAGESEVTKIDADHGLLDDDAISTFESEGSVSVDLEQVDAKVTVATSKSEVGIDRSDAIATTDAGNYFIRIEYNEDIDRTIRLWIPAEYVGPYDRADVSSLSSDHEVDYNQVRDRQYLEILVGVEDQSDIVLPVGRLGGGVEALVSERVDAVESAVGGHFGTGDDWKYLDNESGEERVIDLDIDPDNAILQFDVAGDPADPRWINIPEGETRGIPVYYHVDSNGSMYLVVTADEDLDIRYKEESSITDHARGAINDAIHAIEDLPDRITEWAPDGLLSARGL